MLIAFLFTALIARLIYIESIKSEEFQALALEQWMRDVPLTAERGHIYDRNGVLLADSRTVYTVYVRPASVKNRAETAEALSYILGLKYEDVMGKIVSRRSEMTIAKDVEKDVMLSLVATGVSGVYFSQNIKRVYPYGDFMSQILGFTNADIDGQTGVEMKYNDYLKGKNGYVLTETDLIGRELESNVTKYVKGTKGADAYLTIDFNMQGFAESAVAEAMQKFTPKGASTIIMDVTTGEILAMAQKPSFDLNNIPRDNISELFSNSKSHIVSNVYEPGSTFKILTAAIGLDTGAVTRNYRFYCPGYKIVDGQRIKCWKTIGHGSQTFDEGVMQSCNVLFMNIALEIGAERFYEKLEAFGIMSKTGIDISGESSGLTIPLKSVKNVDLARIGFGQAIAVTSIELLRAASAVVNGGIMVKPYVTDRLENESGILFKNETVKSERIISEKTSQDMREVLELVVKKGSGRQAGVPGYRIGGKTGTAQKYENGVIARGKYVSTFLGFAPMDNPRYAILMAVDEPQGGQYYGSIVAAPYVGQMFKKIFEYKGIKPEAYTEPNTFIMPDITDIGITEAVLTLKTHNLFFEVNGEGAKVRGQIPKAGSLVTEKTVVLLDLI